MRVLDNIAVKAWCLINVRTGALKVSEVIPYKEAISRKDSVDRFIEQFETW